MVKVTKERGNPVKPEVEKAPAPSQVRGSQLMPPKDPISIGPAKEEIKTEPEPEKKEVEREMEMQPKGTISIKLYRDHPYEIDFSGKITGSEVDIAWRAMMKAYRLWKHKIFRDQEHGGV